MSTHQDSNCALISSLLTQAYILFMDGAIFLYRFHAPTQQMVIAKHDIRNCSFCNHVVSTKH